MSQQPELTLAPYPNSPGYKAGGTSRDCAIAIAGEAHVLRERVHELLRQRELTADECAACLEETVLSIRPRLSELRKLGKIVETGARRKNTSGHSANVWRAA